MFNPEIVLKVGTILFIILMSRIRDNFMITQQIKEYEKLQLNTETFDEHWFEAKFSDKAKLSTIEKLLFESYMVMKQKSEKFYVKNIGKLI